MNKGTTGEELFQFHLNGENGIREIAFKVDRDNYESSCDCGYNPSGKLCWHRYYILAGKTQRIPQEELKQQQTLLKKLSQTKGGQSLLNTSKHNFGEKETCRRCNSSNVIDVNRSLYGRFIKLFLKKTRRYYCRSCRWSW